MNDLRIYTDGACRGNPGHASWAFVVFDGTTRKGSKSGYLGSKNTNNQAEMTAILEALKWCKKFGFKPTILTDSNFCKQGLESWMHGWVKKGWKKSDNKEPENLEIWKELYVLYNEINPNIVKVKGHAGIDGNEQADALCNVVLDEVELNARF